MSRGETLFFLVGSERSGTTLLQPMLDHHPKVSVNSESDYLVSQISDSGDYPEIEDYREWLRNDRVFLHKQFVIEESLDFLELVNDLLRQKGIRDRKQIIGATIHHGFRKLAGIWPQAKYIYIYRDGRDVAGAVVRTGWEGNVYAASDWWLKAEQDWDELRRTLHPGNWIEVRYEDLTLKTRYELERICKFIEVKYSDEMLSYTTSKSNYELPDPKKVCQWKRMRKVDVQRMEEKLGDRLSMRGYELSPFPRRSVSWLEKRYLGLQSRVDGLLRRVRQYGAALVLQELLSRRLGLDEMHRNAVRRINRVKDAGLE